MARKHPHVAGGACRPKERDARASLFYTSTTTYPAHPVKPVLIIMVLLVTSDNEQFVVDKEVAERSVLIKNMLEGSYRATSSCHITLI